MCAALGKPGTQDVFQVSGPQAVRRLPVAALRRDQTASLRDVDLDADGLTETLVVAGNEVEAVLFDSGSGPKPTTVILERPQEVRLRSARRRDGLAERWALRAVR